MMTYWFSWKNIKLIVLLAIMLIPPIIVIEGHTGFFSSNDRLLSISLFNIPFILALYYLTKDLSNKFQYNYYIIWLSGSIFWLFTYFAFINKDSNIIVAGATIVLVIVTAYLNSQTRKFAKESLKSQENALHAQKEALNAQQKALKIQEMAFDAQKQPELSIELKQNDQDDNTVDIILKNDGEGSAKNIKFNFQNIPLDKLFITEHIERNQELRPNEKKLIAQLKYDNILQILENNKTPHIILYYTDAYGNSNMEHQDLDIK